MSRYERLFNKHLATLFPESEEGQLSAELLAASLVTAHNRVLRRWLRGEALDPQLAIDAALTTVRSTFVEARSSAEPIVVVLPASLRTADIGRSYPGVGERGRDAPGRPLVRPQTFSGQRQSARGGDQHAGVVSRVEQPTV
ncbi:hypothetical protein DDE18_18580 [Nocardioides gansuensis]|uniref:Uncharacterized protein n=1 Tax=Nocardioides gansuensis TaxID=2138300 RepID=A0A2T8F618_9ACTN|nr:hypothetical protein DDE18_18580 [Nocardioides gansuensis]